MNEPKKGPSQTSGYLGEGITIHGEVHFPDVLRVDGRVTGKLVSDKDLVIGEKGEVDADIEVRSITVIGKVSGSIRVKDRITIHSQGRVQADLMMEKPSLVIEEGGIFEGKIDMNTSGHGSSAGDRKEPPTRDH